MTPDYGVCRREVPDIELRVLDLQEYHKPPISKVLRGGMSEGYRGKHDSKRPAALNGLNSLHAFEDLIDLSNAVDYALRHVAGCFTHWMVRHRWHSSMTTRASRVMRRFESR